MKIFHTLLNSETSQWRITEGWYDFSFIAVIIFKKYISIDVIFILNVCKKLLTFDWLMYGAIEKLFQLVILSLWEVCFNQIVGWVLYGFFLGGGGVWRTTQSTIFKKLPDEKGNKYTYIFYILHVQFVSLFIFP